MNKTKNEQVEELERIKKEHKEVIEALIKLAKDREDRGFILWSNPKEIARLADFAVANAKKTAAAEADNVPEWKTLAFAITYQIANFMMYHAEELDASRASGKVSDSVKSYTQFMVNWEDLFILHQSVFSYGIRFSEDNDECEKLIEGRHQNVKPYLYFVEGLRRQHDWLLDFSYMKI